MSIVLRTTEVCRKLDCKFIFKDFYRIEKANEKKNFLMESCLVPRNSKNVSWKSRYYYTLNVRKFENLMHPFD